MEDYEDKISKYIETYGDQKLNFRGYYEYEFRYSNKHCYISVGDDADSIYRWDLSNVMYLSDLANYRIIELDLDEQENGYISL